MSVKKLVDRTAIFCRGSPSVSLESKKRSLAASKKFRYGPRSGLMHCRGEDHPRISAEKIKHSFRMVIALNASDLREQTSAGHHYDQTGNSSRSQRNSFPKRWRGSACYHHTHRRHCLAWHGTRLDRHPISY